MHMGDLPAYVSVHSMHAWGLRRPERILSPLELHLELWGARRTLGTKPRSLEKIASAFSHVPFLQHKVTFELCERSSLVKHFRKRGQICKSNTTTLEWQKQRLGMVLAKA